MIGDLQSKYLITVKADTAQAKAAIKSLSAEEQAAAKARVDGMERADRAMENSQKRFGLYAAAAAAGWAVISSSVKKYEEHLKSLGTKGEAELARLRDTTGALTKAQDNLQISIAKVALAAAPAAKALADMADELANIVGGVGDLIDQIPGGGAIGTGLKWSRRFANPVAMAGWGLGELSNRFGGSSGGVGRFVANLEADVFEAEMRRMEAESTPFYDEYNNPGRALALRQWGRKPVRKPKPRRGGGGGFELGGTVIDEGAVLGYNMDTPYLIWQRDRALNQRLAQGSRDIGSYADLAGRQSGDLDALMEESAGNEAKAASDKRNDRLAQIFGPLDQFDAYATAFDTLTNAVQSSVEAWVSGSQSASQAFGEVLKQSGIAAAGQMSVEALKHGAYAVVSALAGGLPTGNPMMTAGQHAAAAGKYAAAALAIGGLTRAAIGPVSRGGGGGAGGSYAAAGGIGGRSYGGGGGEGRVVYVHLGDSFGYESPRTRAIQFRNIEREARNRVPPPAGISE